jgi:hypothetical protein
MEIEAHFVKSPDFKTVPVSGAYGGLLGNGTLNLNLFFERGPIPQKVLLDVQDDGSIREKHREGKDGLVREVSMGIIMDLATTKALHALLTQMIIQQENQSVIK